MSREIKVRYLWKEKWYYIDFEKDNLGLKFGEFESRAKTTRLKLWTGLKDKNGKEIYEGDIVRLEEHWEIDRRIPEHEVIVEFLEGHFALIHKAIKAGYIDELHKHVINDRIEVIGNIYENPELLEDGK